MPFGDRTPVVHAGTAQWVGTDAHALGTDGMDVDDVRQVRDIGVQEVVTLGVGEGAASGTRFTALQPPRRISLARLAIAPVASVSAGPPLGGLYLNPPSRAGCATG